MKARQMTQSKVERIQYGKGFTVYLQIRSAKLGIDPAPRIFLMLY
jgi:hypothetical protein